MVAECQELHRSLKWWCSLHLSLHFKGLVEVVEVSLRYVHTRADSQISTQIDGTIVMRCLARTCVQLLGNQSQDQGARSAVTHSWGRGCSLLVALPVRADLCAMCQRISSFQVWPSPNEGFTNLWERVLIPQVQLHTFLFYTCGCCDPWIQSEIKHFCLQFHISLLTMDN